MCEYMTRLVRNFWQAAIDHDRELKVFNPSSRRKSAIRLSVKFWPIIIASTESTKVNIAEALWSRCPLTLCIGLEKG